MAQVEESFISMDDRVPRTKLEETARNELGETEDVKKESLTEIRKLIRVHKVICPCTDDFLLRFLRAKKFNMARSFESFRNYAKQRAVYHKHFNELRPGILKACICQHIIGILPYRDNEGRLICYFRPGAWNPDICSAEEILTVLFLFGTFVVDDESAQIIGTVTLFDLQTFPLSRWIYFIPIIQRLMQLSFNCVPIRYPGLHIISNSVVVKSVHLLVFPFVPKKIADRFVFHKEAGETMCKYLPASILPDAFGGNFAPWNTDHLMELMNNHLERVKNERHYFQQDD